MLGKNNKYYFSFSSKIKATVPFQPFLSEHAYVVWTSSDSSNLHSIFLDFVRYAISVAAVGFV